MDFLNLLWTIVSFVLGIVWSLVWFVLRDLISTLLWILIVAWLVLSARYRSFTAATLAMLRYGRYGFAIFWRWLRGKPPPLPQPIVKSDRVEKGRARRRKSFGTMSISEQLNMILVGAICLLLLV